MLDLSNFPKDAKFFNPDNEKVKKISDEFVGLKSMMYSIKDVYGKESKTGKGVNKNVVKNIKHKN